MRIVILGNGAWENAAAFRRRLLKSDFVIACDGAYRKARQRGIRVDAVIGDLDSLALKPKKTGAEFLVFPVEKDETDGELAVRYALRKNPEEIVWYGAFGGRWDHTFANLFLLEQAAKKKIRARIIQGRWEATLVFRSFSAAARPGDRFSLMPLSEAVRGIKTSGLRYRLNGENLFRRRSRGISNAAVSGKVRIEFKRGLLFVLHYKEMRSRKRNSG